MATSSTAIPDMNPAGSGRGEQEPLLGRPGDAAQPEGRGIQYNFILGMYNQYYHDGIHGEHGAHSDLVVLQVPQSLPRLVSGL